MQQEYAYSTVLYGTLYIQSINKNIYESSIVNLQIMDIVMS